MKNPLKDIFYPDYQRKMVDSTIQELFEAKRAFLAMQQTEQYARAQKEYHVLRVKTLSDTLERLKEINHEALVACNANSINVVSADGTITPNGQGAALSSK